MIITRFLKKKIAQFNKSILLIGPRQTGKSTLIKGFNPDLTIDLANEKDFLAHLSDPGLLQNRIAKKKTVFIDEVQRIPSLLNTVQHLIDNDKTLRFFLTGSSARKLRRGKANLLPGRILSYELGPLTFGEIKSKWNTEQALAHGLLPGITVESDTDLKEKILSSYAATYLKEEIQAEALAKNLEGFSRFFKIAASRSGDFIDFSKVASHAMIERTAARRYFEILTDTLVSNEIAAFTKSKKKRLIQHSKFYFFDTGVLNGILENFTPSPDRIGNLFEHLILQLILSGAKANDHSIRITVYRTESGAEVDFIVERKHEVFAIEVKATKRISTGDLNGLRSFSHFYQKKHFAFVIYLGSETLKVDGIDIFPLADAMDILGY